ncbi:MAG TPA: membrane protein insertion efficiency factor YidD [Flavobacterium sp.]|nr:membrane protein insertion efficiency factor YidD [Flavobacterium sp.]
MKYIVLVFIQLYWKIMPESKRNVCLFSESCSNHIYRITNENGFVKGITALRKRIIKCRPKYELYKVDDTFILKLQDGSVINENEISQFLLPPHNYNYKIEN